MSSKDSMPAEMLQPRHFLDNIFLDHSEYYYRKKMTRRNISLQSLSRSKEQLESIVIVWTNRTITINWMVQRTKWNTSTETMKRNCFTTRCLTRQSVTSRIVTTRPFQPSDGSAKNVSLSALILLVFVDRNGGHVELKKSAIKPRRWKNTLLQRLEKARQGEVSWRWIDFQFLAVQTPVVQTRTKSCCFARTMNISRNGYDRTSIIRRHCLVFVMTWDNTTIISHRLDLFDDHVRAPSNTNGIGHSSNPPKWNTRPKNAFGERWTRPISSAVKRIRNLSYQRHCSGSIEVYFHGTVVCMRIWAPKIPTSTTMRLFLSIGLWLCRCRLSVVFSWRWRLRLRTHSERHEKYVRCLGKHRKECSFCSERIEKSCQMEKV